MSSVGKSDAEGKAVAKDYARENRLSFRKFAESQMRREFKDMAFEKCSDQVKEFAECAHREGLAVVFRCQHLNRAVNECMALHNSDEAWEKYKAEHQDELDKRTLRT